MAGMKFGYSDNISGNCYCDECGAYGRARKENPPEGNKNKKEVNSIIPISEILGRISQLKIALELFFEICHLNFN